MSSKAEAYTAIETLSPADRAEVLADMNETYGAHRHAAATVSTPMIKLEDIPKDQKLIVCWTSSPYGLRTGMYSPHPGDPNLPDILVAEFDEHGRRLK